MFSFVLIHQFNKERKVVEAEVVTPAFVSIRWALSGVYDLLLDKNILRARSQKAQRKGKPLWGAEDIHAVRKMVFDHLKGLETEQDKERQKAEFRRHEKSMPHAVKPACVCGWANCEGACAGKVKAR